MHRQGGRGRVRLPLQTLQRRQCRHFATNFGHDYQDALSSDPSGTNNQQASTAGSSAVLSQRPLPTDATHLQMISFYHFEPIPDPWTSRDELFASIGSIPGLRGTIYLAHEGINAQLAVPTGESLEQLLNACSSSIFLPFGPFRDNEPNLGDIVPIETPTFNRLIVRVRDYVLRDGIALENTDDNEDVEGGDDESTTTSTTTTTTATLDWTNAGPELSPEEWHRDLKMSSSSSSSSSSSPLLLDCRNAYESEQGTFQGAIPLQTSNFQESWPVLKELTKDLPKNQPLRIFCTGGIRCVKVGAYLKQALGFENVQRLQHGIIGYQQWIDKHKEQETEKDESSSSLSEITESLWQGENFLFDKRWSFTEEEGKS